MSYNGQVIRSRAECVLFLCTRNISLDGIEPVHQAICIKCLRGSKSQSGSLSTGISASKLINISRKFQNAVSQYRNNNKKVLKLR